MHVRALSVPAACFCLFTGCDLSDLTGGGRAAAPPASQAPSDPPAASPVASAPQGVASGVAPVALPPSSANPPATASTPPAAPAIRLSAGVALAQTLPDGTAMGFSVDYRFVQGGPDSSTRYVWVIQPASGQPTVVPVELEPSGTLQTFTKFRPEHGPFQCFLAEETASGEHSPLSDPLSMR